MFQTIIPTPPEWNVLFNLDTPMPIPSGNQISELLFSSLENNALEISHDLWGEHGNGYLKEKYNP